jgi:hypothetical protein
VEELVADGHKRHHEDQQIILGELERAGVELGSYDRRMVAWLAGLDYETIVTVASWIRRAHG